jgi:uncharacterized membrane protein YfcA
LPDLFSPEFAGLACVTLVAGLVRGFTGFGAGLLMAPWFLMMLGPSRAVPVLVALELVASIRLVPGVLREIDPRSTLSLALPACLAVPLGSWLLVGLDPVPVRRAISLIILVFVALLASGWRYRSKPPGAALAVSGAFSGLLSGFGGVGGPPVVLLLVSGPETAVRNRATLIVFFAMTQTMATLAFAFHGLLTGDVLWRAVLLAPVFLLGTHLGASWFQPGRDRLYRNVALALVGISGIAGMI